MKKHPRWTTEEAASVGGRIRALREREGLSQRELVAGTSVTAAYVSRIEKGERYPSVVVMRELAERLRASAEFIEHGGQGDGPIVCAKANPDAINRAAQEFGSGLTWEDLAPDERQQVVRGLDEALVDTLAARIHAVALGRQIASREFSRRPA